MNDMLIETARNWSNGKEAVSLLFDCQGADVHITEEVVAFSNIVQQIVDQVGRELVSAEIQDLFERTYFLKENPRFQLLDYTVNADLSTASVHPTSSKRRDAIHLKRRFEGVISIDGQEHSLKGTGNGPISSLANALHSIGIDLDIRDYKEHAIGKGRAVKAVSYIECITASSIKLVWGVGVYEDVMESPLLAVLSAVSNFISSRSNKHPLPRREHRSIMSQDLGLNSSLKENGTLSIPRPDRLPKSGPDAASVQFNDSETMNRFANMPLEQLGGEIYELCKALGCLGLTYYNRPWGGSLRIVTGKCQRAAGGITSIRRRDIYDKNKVREDRAKIEVYWLYSSIKDKQSKNAQE